MLPARLSARGMVLLLIWGQPPPPTLSSVCSHRASPFSRDAGGSPRPAGSDRSARISLVPSDPHPGAWPVFLLPFSFLLLFYKKEEGKKKPKQVRVIYNSLIFCRSVIKNFM